MSKYTSEEIRAKAICTMNGLDEGMEWATMVVIVFAQSVGMTPEMAMQRIIDWAYWTEES